MVLGLEEIKCAPPLDDPQNDPQITLYFGIMCVHLISYFGNNYGLNFVICCSFFEKKKIYTTLKREEIFHIIICPLVCNSDPLFLCLFYNL